MRPFAKMWRLSLKSANSKHINFIFLFDLILSLETKSLKKSCFLIFWHKKRPDTLYQTYAYNMEQVTGIEPAYLAWKANVLPLNYTCIRHWRTRRDSNPRSSAWQADMLTTTLLVHCFTIILKLRLISSLII